MSTQEISTAKAIAQKYMLGALKIIRDNGPNHQRFGICSNVDAALISIGTQCTPSTDAVMYELFEKWPKFTGTPEFPVPHPHLTPAAAYAEPDIWEGTYGDNRKELLNFMIAELEKDIGL